MKYLAAFLMILSLSVFSIGCKPAEDTGTGDDTSTSTTDDGTGGDAATGDTGDAGDSGDSGTTE